jgi:hypothetical protein
VDVVELDLVLTRIVAAFEALPFESTLKSANEYVVPAARPFFVNEWAGRFTVAAALPAVTEEGAFVPFAKRTTVFVTVFAFGRVQVSVTLLVVRELVWTLVGATGAAASAEPPRASSCTVAIAIATTIEPSNARDRISTPNPGFVRAYA